MRILLAMTTLALMAAGPSGDLYQPAYCMDHCLRGPAQPYEPQVGDLILFTDDSGSLFWAAGFAVAGSGHPYHSGIVVKLPSGELATLESGPDDSRFIEVCSLVERLRFHHCNRGRVWIRRRKVPLTEEESCKLTEFAITQRHTRYAIGRLGVQVTPFRSRGPIRTNFMGESLGPHRAYFCSEVVLEASVYAGIMDPCTTRPRATFPRDFFFDRSPNRYVNKHIGKLACTWEPPARLCFDCPPCHEYKGRFRKPNPNAIPIPEYFKQNCSAAISPVPAQ